VLVFQHFNRGGVMRAPVVCSVVFGLFVVSLSAQTPPQRATTATPAPTGTGVIAGVLTAADKGTPVRKASVRLTRVAPGVSREVASDEEGRFVFADLPAGDYRLTATRPGFLDTVYGARQPGSASPGTPITLADGQRVEKLAIAMPRGGVISGILTDEYGDAAFNVPVRALLYRYANGERVVTTAGNAVTDDRGAYRIAGLLPGEYLISALPRDSVSALSAQANAVQQRVQQMMAQAIATGDERMLATARADSARMGPPPPPPPSKGYVPVYHPGVAQPSTARVVRVGVSEEVWNIDFALQVLETAAVSGVVTNSEGALPLDTRVQLIDPALPVASIGVWFRNTDSDGRFDFHGVVPGTYVLRAHASLPPQQGGGFLDADTMVTIAPGDKTEATLTLRPGITVTGRVAVGSLPEAFDRSRLMIQMRRITTSADWESPVMRGPVAADGTFSIPHVAPGRYTPVLSGLPDGWAIDTAMFGQVNAADLHITIEHDRPYVAEITLTTRSAAVSGTVTNADGDPISSHTIVIFPEDRSMWLPQSRRIRVTQPGPDGTYSVTLLPPGDYRIATLLDPEAGREFDPQWLGELYPQSERLTLGPGEARTLPVRVR
jgi:hypothetical protein